MTVPNKFPTYESNKRIAIVGEVPSIDDNHNSQPFTGSAGRFLAALLSRAGASREGCYLGNVSQELAPSNNVANLSWTGSEIQDGLEQLKADMAVYKPNIVILLGSLPLKAAKEPLTNHPLVLKAFPYKVAKWRGSLFEANDAGPFANLKCIASYHPSYLWRDYDSVPLLQFDLRKAVRESTSPLLNLPPRKIQISYDEETIIASLQAVRSNKRTVAIDIEGYIDAMSCISFADSPDNAFIVPIFNKSGQVFATPRIWRELALTLEDENVPKILQNSLYDRFVLHYSYGIRVRNVVHDTMLKHWELYAELEKSLAVQASIYTDEPYYKGDGKSQDDQTFYEYCCRDSAVTLEISQYQDKLVLNEPLKHYELNMGLLNTILYMEMRGMRYDVQGAKYRRTVLCTKLHEAQARLNGLTGHGYKWDSVLSVKRLAYEIFYTKKGDRVRKEYLSSVARFTELLKQNNPSLATMGELEDLGEVSLNVGSGKQFMAYLYEYLKLPVQMSQVRGKEPHPTADYEALLNLSKWCQQNKHSLGFQVVQAAIELRSLQTRQQMLSISADKDGRIRCGYNLVGSNTGRITCYESPTGSGYNLQTIPNHTDEATAPGGVLGDRDLFLADEGFHLFQCDLSGADGWTVAAYCAMLGDPTMLEHYRFGIKPYAAIALKLAGRQLDFRDTVALKAATKQWKMNDMEKLVAKRVQHGGAYLEGGLTISRNITKDSEGKINMSPAECDKLKNWYIREMYHGIPKWHDWVARRLKESPVLTMASGHKRQFFGRPDDILPAAIAAEPQHNTTYATNLAAWRLWKDGENRIGTACRLRIEPQHQVHDALIGQFHKSDTDWAVSKIKSYFNNTLLIAGQQIIIPFEGGYGPSWGNLNAGKI